MNTKTYPFLVIALFGSVFVLSGCAGTKPAHPGQTMAAAGFQVRTPTTPRQKTIYASLPPNQMHRLNVNGKTYYVYKDASKGIAFVGGEAEYQRYRQMARQDVVDANNAFTQMDDAAARSWSSEYALSSDFR